MLQLIRKRPTKERIEPSAHQPADGEALLDVSVLRRIVDHGTAKQRLECCRQLFPFFNSSEIQDIERQQLKPIMLKLAIDPEFRIRQFMAQKLKRSRILDPDIIFTIISDLDDIALDFIKVSPALAQSHLRAILQVGDVRRQAAIAGRGDLPPEAVDQIVKTGAAEVVAALLDNPFAIISDKGYYHMYRRFNEDDVMIEKLMTKKNLPLEVRVLQAKRVSSRLLDMMLEKDIKTPANDLGEVVMDAEEGIILDVLKSAKAEEFQRVLQFMSKHDMLRPSLVLRAACAGEFRLVTHALAYLSGKPPEKVQFVLRNSGMSAVRSLVVKAGFPPSCINLINVANEAHKNFAKKGETPTVDTFGRALIRLAMTRFMVLDIDARNQLFHLIGTFADKRSREIAMRLKNELSAAA